MASLIANQNQADWILELIRSMEHTVIAIAFSPNRQLLALALENGQIGITNLTTGKKLQFIGHRESVSKVLFSPDGQRLASVSQDWEIKLWDLNWDQNTEVHLRCKRLKNEVFAVAFSPDGGRLRIVSDAVDATIRLCGLTTDECRQFNVDGVYSVAFSPDGQRLATASEDMTIRLWDLVTGEQLLELNGHSETVMSVAFSPDGQQLASASRDGTARIWDLTTRQQLQKLGSSSEPVLMVAFLPDAQWLVSSDGTTIKLWNVTGKEHLQVDHPVNAIAFSPGPQVLI